MNRFWLLLAFALTFGCIEGPVIEDETRQADEDSPRSGFVDLVEFEVPDLNSGRSDAGAVTPEPVEENPFPNGRDEPPPTRPDAGPEVDSGQDENGRTPEDIANREDVG